MIDKNRLFDRSQLPSLFAIGFAFLIQSALATEGADPVPVISTEAAVFHEQVQPLLQKYCVRCHNIENMKSGVRVDQLTATPEDRQLFLLKTIQKQVDDGVMPPADELQLTTEQRQTLNDWIVSTINNARARDTKKNGSVRRLTVSQYRNTLKSLLLLDEDLTESLPPDGISKEGFTNQSHTMILSPIQVESYFNIAEKGLDLCIVDKDKKPVIQNFRVDLGTAINPEPCPDKLVLGANNLLLNNPDVLVTELKPVKSFDYQPFVMRKEYDFIEGYIGNDTIRAWKKFNSIYHSVFACMRGSPGYPKGQAFQVVPEGLLLRPAIPSPEIFGQSDTYGPMANFKISLRELPEEGNFRVTVRAARYDDALLLDAESPAQTSDDTVSIPATEFTSSPHATVRIMEAGIYQLDVACSADPAKDLFAVTLGDRQFAGQLRKLTTDPNQPNIDEKSKELVSAFLLVRLPAGELKLSARLGDNSKLRRLVVNRLENSHELSQRFSIFERRSPSLGVYLGLRRDCGSTLTQVGQPQTVASCEIEKYVFEGAINDFPNPDVEKDNVNYLAGIREIGVRSEYTDGRDMPRLRIQSVEFEGPYYESWPPATHQNIFNVSVADDEPAVEARTILQSFARRAFRRPINDTELDAIFSVWQKSFADSGNQRQSIKDALLVVLNAPQFLFLIENSQTPEPEDLDPYELASKLSYFLWNTAPDQHLLDLASKKELLSSLDSETERMIRDPRFEQFINEFASQWLSLDKLDVVSVDSKRYPRLTRDTKTQLRQEPVQFLRYLIEQNLPLRNLVQSDFIVANEVVANYYNLGSQTENGFQFVPIKHGQENLGGVLTHAGILAGLSDGRESNPIKRGAWVARKIIAEPPDDPPPNVPRIKEDDGTQLTLREKLEQHRNQQGCAKCHSGIDPWGFPFESFDAGGLLKTTANIDPRSTLPDGTEVKDLNGLKTYLANDRIDQVAFSFMKHLACYAIGRSLTYNEFMFLQEQGKNLRSNDYRMHDMIKFVIKSDLFIKK
jgi:mono/diheme cytochrome c family protein